MAGCKFIDKLTELAGYDTVCVTGGEPMLDWRRTLSIITHLRFIGVKTIFLYTALYRDQIAYILPHVDGVQFSLHAEATFDDLWNFQLFQGLIRKYPGKSYRAFIDNKIGLNDLVIKPNLWHRLEIKPWLTETDLLKLQPNGLPPTEELFCLTSA
jgi:organic radical activating enzyme